MPGQPGTVRRQHDGSPWERSQAETNSGMYALLHARHLTLPPSLLLLLHSLFWRTLFTSALLLLSSIALYAPLSLCSLFSSFIQPLLSYHHYTLHTPDYHLPPLHSSLLLFFTLPFFSFPVLLRQTQKPLVCSQEATQQLSYSTTIWHTQHPMNTWRVLRGETVKQLLSFSSPSHAYSLSLPPLPPPPPPPLPPLPPPSYLYYNSFSFTLLLSFSPCSLPLQTEKW